MNVGLVTALIALVALSPLTGARAEVRSLTLGITMNCPYGLAGCWPGVHEALTLLPGVKAVSERASAQTWTCQIQMQEGRLPDLAGLERHLRNRRVGATLRGVEAVVEGSLAEEKGELLLRVSGTGEVVRLVPLRHKVQWDVPAKREQAPTDAERDAYTRLRAWRRGQSLSVQVTGPLTQSPDARYPTLEVRQFDTDPQTSKGKPL